MIKKINGKEVFGIALIDTITMKIFKVFEQEYKDLRNALYCTDKYIVQAVYSEYLLV